MRAHPARRTGRGLSAPLCACLAATLGACAPAAPPIASTSPASSPTIDLPTRTDGAATTSRPATAPGARPTTTGLDGRAYALAWSDEFDRAGDPDPARWAYQTGGSGWGNDELQYYTDGGNAAVAGGVLTVTARREPVGGRSYTSARLTSRDAWRYGVVEVRAQLPRGVGTWPAIWLMPRDSVYGTWPDSGEMDIMEHVGFDQDTIVGTVHTAASNGARGTQRSASIRVPGVSDAFHVYRLEWRPDAVTMTVDGQPSLAYARTDGMTSREWPFDQPFYLILNVAVGGSWGGAHGVDDSVFPQSLVVDHVRVYQ